MNGDDPRSALRGRHVVVTGGAGALGAEVVAAFRRAGAVVHVPVRGARAPAELAALPEVRVVTGVELTDDAVVTAFYAGLPGDLWASVHVAGGFTMGGIGEA